MSEVFNIFAPWIPRYMINPHLRSLPVLRNRQKEKNTYVDLTCVTSIDIYNLHLVLIRGIDKSDPSIPWIEVACHSLSKASTVDQYFLLVENLYGL